MPPLGHYVRIVFVRPFERFFRYEAAGGIVLLAVTAIAVTWANSPFADAYEALRHTRLVVGAGAFSLDKDLLHWVNDGLMAIFFFLVGLEIKREFLTGHLSNRRAATLPAVAALGGMIVPAAIYVAFNRGGPGASGWGIPMATDIAFALGAVALLGPRVPAGLRVFLAALAIVDDLGAVLVIAVFYTPEVSVRALGAAALVLLALVALNRGGVRRPAPYMLLGVILWLAVFQSGVHATVAGVLLAFTIPASARIGHEDFVGKAQEALTRFPTVAALTGTGSEAKRVAFEERQAALLALEEATEDVEAPLSRIEHKLVPWVSFGVVPIFALMNAGVALGGDALAALTGPVSAGIIVGLVFGKQVGITLFPWIAVKLGLADLPAGASWRHLYGIGWLAGIGFTMSLFISSLALPPDLEENAKLGILAASLIAGIGGFVVLGTAKRAP